MERNATEVAAILATGETQASVARMYGVDPSAVHLFIKRHEEDIEAIRAEIEREVADYAISQKVNRIAAMQDRWDRMRQLIDARSKDDRYAEPGYETGLMVHQLKAVGRGEDFQLVDLYVTDSGLLAEMRATEHAAAEELAQLPRPDTNLTLNIDNRRLVVYSNGDRE